MIIQEEILINHLKNIFIKLSIYFTKNILIEALLISFVLLFVNSYFLMIIPFLVLVFLLFNKNDEFIIGFTIITFLYPTNYYNITIRSYLQIFNLFLLLYIFLRVYGIDYKNYPQINKKFLGYISLAILIMIVTTIFSNYKMIAFVNVIRFCGFLFFMYLYYAWIYKTKTITTIFNSILVSALIFLILLIQKLLSDGVIYFFVEGSNIGRVITEALHPNEMGIIFLMAISILRVYKFQDITKQKKYLINISIIILVIASIIINSRSTILVLMISSLYWWYITNKKVFFRGIIFLFLLVPIIFIPAVYDFIDIYFRLERLTTGRDSILLVSGEIIKNNFLFGVGPGVVGNVIYTYMPYKFGSPEEIFMRGLLNMGITGQIHNFYISLFCELGIMGFILAITTPIVYLNSAIKIVKTNSSFSINWYYGHMFTAIGISYFIRGLFEPYGIMSYGFLLHDLPLWLIIISMIFIHNNKKVELLK